MTRAISADGPRAGALLIERAYREGEDGQFLRELTQNGFEAGATKIQFGIHWHGVVHDWSAVDLPIDCKIYSDRFRMVYYDNGRGMGAKMGDYMAGLLDLDSKDQAAGGLHGNFGMGARVSLLPWNRAGLIIASWSDEVPEGHLMWIRYRHDSASAEQMGHYEAINLNWLDEHEEPHVDEIAPAIYFEEFTTGCPEWLGLQEDGTLGTGTMFLMLGNTGQENTFLGPEGKWGTHTGPNYLTHRYWEHPHNVDIRYEDPRSAEDSSWKSRRRDRFGRTTLDGSSPKNKQQRVFNEPVRSVKGVVTGRHSKKTAEHETIDLPEGGRIHVHLLPETTALSGGGRRAAGKPGISVLYNGELYHRRDGSRDYQRFAVVHSAVYRRLSIVIEPHLAETDDDPRGGVYPTGSRTTLHYLPPLSGKGDRPSGLDLPWTTWQDVFVNNMPEFVTRAIDSHIDDSEDEEIDSEILEQVSAPFMDRFSQIDWREILGGKLAGTRNGDEQKVPVRRLHPSLRPGPGDPTEVADPSSGTTTVVNSGAVEINGEHVGENLSVPAAVPKVRFDASAFDDDDDDVEINGVRQAVKYRSLGEGSLGEVVIDPSFPLIKDIKKYWCGLYPEQYEREVIKAVEAVYKVSFACRVGQILSMARQTQNITAGALEKTLLSNFALTSSLYGLAAEHAAIKQKTSGYKRIK